MKNVQLAFFYFFAYLSLGCILSQLMIELSIYSLNVKTWILGLSAILAFLFSFGLGKLSDSIQKVKPSFYISISFYIISIILIYITHDWYKMIFYVVMIASSRMVMSSAETLVFMEKKNLFSKYHCLGVIGLIISSLIVYVLEGIYRLLFCILCVFFSILFIYRFEEHEKKKSCIQIKDIIMLMKNKEYLLIVFIFFFLMLMGFGDQYVVVEKMIFLKADKILIVLKYCLQALMEIPIYLGMNRIMKKISINNILLFCILMSAIKFLLYGYVSTPIMILAVSLLQLFTHPLIVILSKHMIALCVDEKKMASSQIIGFAIYFGLSGFVSAFIGNMLSQWFSYDIALYIFSSFAVFPLILWYFYKKYDKVDNV